MRDPNLLYNRQWWRHRKCTWRKTTCRISEFLLPHQQCLQRHHLMAQVLEGELVLVLEAVLELDTDRVWVPAAAVVLAAEFTKWAEGFPLLLRFRPRILTT